jgi:hypothetical protein
MHPPLKLLAPVQAGFSAQRRKVKTVDFWQKDGGKKMTVDESL